MPQKTMSDEFGFDNARESRFGQLPASVNMDDVTEAPDAGSEQTDQDGDLTFG
jgi:hypothetical protein